MTTRRDFKEDMIVINTKTNKSGIVVLDVYAVCTAEEVPVQYDDVQGYRGTDWRDLCPFDFS